MMGELQRKNVPRVDLRDKLWASADVIPLDDFVLRIAR